MEVGWNESGRSTVDSDETGWVETGRKRDGKGRR